MEKLVLVGEMGKITLSPLKKDIPGTKVTVPCEFIHTTTDPINLARLTELQTQTVVITIQPRQVEMDLGGRKEARKQETDPRLDEE